MVYDKLHASSHPVADELDELYEKVEQGMSALDSFYVLREYIGLCEHYKFDIYDYLNDDYDEYLSAYNKTEVSEASDASDS